MSQSKFRLDIQALRGWAVVLVVLQHSAVVHLPGGFLGVDIFFVISGFLMGRILVSSLESETFSFHDFYVRRARRLLPAVYATIIVTAAVAPLLLDPVELRAFVDQVIGAFTFTTNIVLWRQIDYFNSDSALKPLLHLWSLAVEEQFYLILPLLLWATAARFRTVLCVVSVMTSAIACIYFSGRSPSAAFYMLPTRAWELGIGTVAAMLVWRVHLSSIVRLVLQFVSAAILLVAPFVSDERGHPGYTAAIVCVATAALLILGSSKTPVGPLRPLAWLGDRSYSLYLVHWPVFAFANNVFVDHVPVAVRWGLLVLSLVWMEAQYRFVERRFRRFAISRSSVAALLCIPIVVGIGLASWLVSTAGWRQEDQRANVGLGVECTVRGNYLPRPSCRTTRHAETLVWGDSFAMHLMPGIVLTSPNGVVQATQPVCGPFLGLGPFDNARYYRPWAEQCIRFNQSVLDYLRQSDELRTVVLSSSLLQYLPGGEGIPWRMLAQAEDIYAERPLDTEMLIASVRRTVDALRYAGKKVVLVAPPPSTNFDFARCRRRQEAHVLTVAPASECELSHASYLEVRRPVIDFLQALRDRQIVEVISFDSFLCREGTCHTMLDHVGLYRDKAHLSTAGSMAIARSLDLGRIIGERAR